MKRAVRLTRGREVRVFPSYISLTVMLWADTTVSETERETGWMLPVRQRKVHLISFSLMLCLTFSLCLGVFLQARTEEWLLNRETLTPYRCIRQLRTLAAEMAAAEREVIIRGLL